MNERYKKFIQNWENTKKQGFKKYVLTHGLAFGIITSIINLLFIKYNNDKEMPLDSFFISLALMIVLGGLSYAGVSWLINDYIYLKKTKKK
jgi:hypothetical protein